MCLACQTKIQLCMEGTFQSWADIVSRRTVIVFIVAMIAFIALCKSLWRLRISFVVQDNSRAYFFIIPDSQSVVSLLYTPQNFDSSNRTRTMAFYIFMKSFAFDKHMTGPTILSLSICSNLLFAFLYSSGHVTISLF